MTHPPTRLAKASGDDTRRVAAGRGRPLAVDRILVIRLGAMGDVVRTLPAVARLRSHYSGAHLAWLVEPAAAGVVDASGLVDETLVFPRRELVGALSDVDGLALGAALSGFVRQLRARRFEMTLDFHGLLKSGLLARLSGAAIRVGFDRPMAREGSQVFSNHLVRSPAWGVSRFDRNQALVDSILGVPSEIPDGPPLLVASPLARARLSARLRVSGGRASAEFVLIHPGSSASAAHKRYGVRGWVEVTRLLAGEGLAVWVAAGADRGERLVAEAIVREGRGDARLAPETRSFDDLIALQTRASVVLACDSGPLHAAALAGVPVVQLMGPTHPRQNAPWEHSLSRRLRVPLACSPCRRGCADPACMASLPPASVAAAARSLLRAGSVRATLGPGGTMGAGESGA